MIIDEGKAVLRKQQGAIEEKLKASEDPEVQEFGKRIIDLYEQRIEEVEKLEINTFHHIGFLPEQGLEHTLTSARGLGEKDEHVAKALKKYERAAKNNPMISLARKFHIKPTKSIGELELANLREALRTATKPQGLHMAGTQVEEALTRHTKDLKNACVQSLESQYAAHGESVFSGNYFKLVETVSSEAALKYLPSTEARQKHTMKELNIFIDFNENFSVKLKSEFF